MKRLTLGFLAVAVTAAIAPNALGTSINGSVAVEGFHDQWSATGVIFNDSVGTAGNATGSFATVIGPAPATAPATINASTWTFASPDELIFTVGSDTATFTTTGPVDVVTDDGSFLDVSGAGELSLTGYDPTAGTFVFTSGATGDNYGVSGSSTFEFDVGAGSGSPYNSPVPEPGTLLLLGTGLAGMAAMVSRRRSTRHNA